MRLAVPFGKDEVLTEGTKGAGIIKGGRVVPEVAGDKAVAIGATGGNGWGMDRLGMLPIPKGKKNIFSSASKSVIKHMPENKFIVQWADPIFTGTLWAN